MLDTVLRQPITQPDRAQQLHRRVFEDACPDARQHVVLGAGFDDHGVDSVGGKQVRQQHVCRAGADDGNLGAHARQ
jgi:hypothetical protein